MRNIMGTSGGGEGGGVGSVITLLVSLQGSMLPLWVDSSSDGRLLLMSLCMRSYSESSAVSVVVELVLLSASEIPFIAISIFAC